ncbi:bifunctional RNase H/acid phosphatase [Hoyosella sp. YIM 151337]|uniref:bifunctional RNase H/acid phosphatase n=1 Tax=Hoyosella sp. YIM 151337 TaxID=2992742 RepID=UPI002235D131|nr:bifunctional RNase H/acid phosphatase [Hoyosella sp. YIM 151337]MCW4355348.1 bifunctional RNase H/acid phosphatase [Hoyosella sp. YIM 151337]
MNSVHRVVVEADGGSRGNPGPAGYGAVVLDPSDRAVLAERKLAIGVATNNVAEYSGLIAGLQAAAELGATEVEVRMDSKLVVEQMSGRWKVKHPDMIPLARKAAELARSFSHVEYTWVPRAQNSHADRLANEAMDAAAALPAAEDPHEPASATLEIPGVEVKASEAPGWTGAVGKPARLLLLRHGQTRLSIERRYSGRGDHELTAEGQRQARCAAERLSRQRGRVAAVVASPLSRARQTAEAVASELGLDVVVHDGLIETDFGAWEGLTFSEASDRDPELFQRWMGDTSVAPPGGEAFDEVQRRIEKAKTELVAEYGGSNVILVTHVTPIKMILKMALDVGPSLLFRLHLDLASLSIAEFYDDGGAAVRLVNDTSHMH